jgi:hypothetical protein
MTGDVVPDLLNAFNEPGGGSGDGETTCLGIVAGEETCEVASIDRDERVVATGVEALGDYKILDTPILRSSKCTSAPSKILPHTSSSQEVTFSSPLAFPLLTLLEAPAPFDANTSPRLEPTGFLAPPETRLWKSTSPLNWGSDAPDGSIIAERSSFRCESLRYWLCSLSTRSERARMTLTGQLDNFHSRK